MHLQHTVKSLFKHVEPIYENCWKLFSKIRNQTSFELREFLQFQPKLAEALLEIDKVYRYLHQEKKRLIDKKSKLSLELFEEQMRQISQYQELAKQLIAIGKTIGDSFAWIFYSNDRLLLTKHYEHEAQQHMPPGIGGIGELEFLRSVPFLDGHLVLYHGITTFLRLGDVSLISIQDLKVKAVGELKTRRHNENDEFTVTLIASLYSVISDFQPGKQIKVEINKSFGAEFLSDFPQKMQDRFDRQMAKISNFFQVEKLSILRMPRVKNPSFVRLKELFEESKIHNSRGAFGKVSKSVFLLCSSIEGDDLYDRLETGSLPDFKKAIDFDGEASQIILEDSQYNSLFIDIILAPKPEYHLEPGLIPLGMYPLPLELIRSIIFLETVIISVYNPAHLIKNLQEIGFLVDEIPGKDDFSIKRKVADNLTSMDSIAQFIKLVGKYFMPENLVVDIICSACESAKEHKDKDVEIKMLLWQDFVS